MLIPEIKNDPSKVQLSRPSHVYFEHPNLKEFEKFAVDFGFVQAHRTKDTIYYRGYGIDQYVYVAKQSKDGQPRFLGTCFVAKNEEEFNKCVALEGAKEKPLTDAPGGGRMITFERPGNTFLHVIHGQKEREVDVEEATSATHDSLGPPNTPFQKPRKGQFQRFHPGPAAVHKLGHFGYVCVDFDKEIEWHTKNFNFVASDVLYHPQLHQVDVVIFMHLDLGQAFSDHHCFFFQRAPPEVKKTYMHHTSYEVADFDTQSLGHEWLAKKGWKSAWGIGRHILGSQIFDYWEDNSGFKIEHYADGDLVNEEVKPTRGVAGPVYIWGPEMPRDFGENKAHPIPV